MLDYYMLTTVRYDRLKNRGRGVVQYTSANNTVQAAHKVFRT